MTKRKHKAFAPDKPHVEARVEWKDDAGNKHRVTYKDRPYKDGHDNVASVGVIETMAAAAIVPDKAIVKLKERKRIYAEKAEKALELAESEDDPHRNRTKPVRALARSIFGRQALTEACKKKGIDPDKYADVVKKSYDVGMDDKHPDAKDARKHFTGEITRLGNIDANREDKPPQIIIVIGDNFKEASHAHDERNTGHPLEAPQWSDSSDEEPG